MAERRRGVYLITPDSADTDLLLARTAAALSAGVALLQYRNKSADAPLRRHQAERLCALTHEFKVPLLINDHIDLARTVGADGVHLGGDDAPIELARETLGDRAIIGASCYADPDRARAVVRRGADYIAFGAFAASLTKPGAARASPALLTAAAGLGVPRVAIGGIDSLLAPELVAAGADLLAVISFVYESPDPASAVRALRNAFPDL
jgi:thiamine-phosphate pyrophosphorylase